MPTQTFPATPAQMAKFRAALQNNNIVVPPGNTGQINDPVHHIVFSFIYDGAANLTITIISKPWYIPASTIWTSIQNELLAV